MTPTPSSADIRTFRAADSRTALSAIRAALGSDAIILQTREVPRLFGKSEIEVTAARGGMAAESRGDTQVRDESRDESHGHVHVAVQGDPREELRTDDAYAERENAEYERRRRQADRRRQGEGGARSGGGDMTPQRSDVFRQMAARGVDENLAADLVGQALNRGAGSNPGALMAEVVRLVRERLRPAPTPWHLTPEAASGPERGQRIMALLGPTGVGKTTTLAKIAARALLESHLKVALITVDTYRLGASDQLARYGKIMGIKAHIARDAAGLADAAAQCRDADLVLIDTAGRSDRGARQAQAQMLRTLPDVEFHLVLSAATGAREIGAMARHYEEIEPDHLIFSKLDEAHGPGSVLSAATVIPRSVSCITDGQRVPEDIHSVTSRILTSLVFAPPDTAEGDPWIKPTASDS